MDTIFYNIIFFTPYPPIITILTVDILKKEYSIMDNLHNYLDYRDYIANYYSTKKKETKGFSLRAFGRMIDIDASYLAKIINKSRHISERSVPIITEYFNFNNEEKEYFKQLVKYTKSKNEDEKKANLIKLLSLKQRFTKSLDSNQYAYYQKWYYTAIRNLLEFYKFKPNGDYKELAKQLAPKITEKQARESIKLLEELSLIEVGEDGFYRLTEQAITTGEQWKSIAIKDYQKETIRLCSNSLDNHPKEKRDISTVTMNITEEEFHIIRNSIKDLRKSTIGIANSVEKPNQVYQLNIQLIPLTDTSMDN